MNHNINVSQVGVGYWGPNLLRNLINFKNFEVKKIVELSNDRLAFIHSTFPGIPTTKKLEEILEDPGIEAVVISTPANTHYDIAIKCLNKGKNVLIEKPMATTAAEIDKIIQISRRNNLIAMVGHTFLFNPAVIFIKKIIDSGEIGDVRYIYSQRLNLGRIRQDVDVLWNLAPHDISIIQYWLNNPEPLKIFRNGMDYVQKDIDDVVFLNIKYPNKVIANIHVSWLDPNKVRNITIVGSKKMIFYDDISENKIKIYDKGIDPVARLGENMDYDDINSLLYNYRSGGIKIPKIKWSEPLKNEIEHFYNSIIQKEKCLTDATHAKSVVKILEMSSYDK